MAYTSVFEEYLESLGATDDSPKESYFPGLVETPAAKETRNSLYDFLGNAAWGALDEAGFAIPGVIAKQAGIETITPETGLGAAGEVAGRFGGFVFGAPLKVGAKAATLAARPLLKATGKASYSGVARAVKNSGVIKSKGMENVASQATRKYQVLNQKAKWSEDVASNFASKSTKILNNTVDNNIARKVITQAEGDALKKVFKDNMTKQSFDDFIGLMQSRYPGKKGFIMGEMLNEAIVWGTIDGLMEFPRAYAQDRPYDMFQPLWGVGIGSTMGIMQGFLPGGKGSSFRKDFIDGLKGVFSRGHFKNMSYEDLINHSKIHAGFKEKFEASPQYTKVVDYQGQSFDVNFRAPELLDVKTLDGKLLTDKTKEGILRKALGETTAENGKELIKWAAKEEWDNISQNWGRMLMTGAIFNMPVLAELGNLDQMAPESLATQFLIGAFMGRKGMASSQDLGRQVNHVRKGLSSLGLDPSQLISNVPTFGAAGVSELNPLNNHEHFRDIQNNLRESEIGIISNKNDELSRKLEPGEESAAIAASKEDLSVFEEFHYYLNGTAKENESVLTMDQIPADVARKVQQDLKNKKWEILDGAKIQDAEDFRIVMDDQVEKSVNLFEKQIIETVKTIMREPGVNIEVSNNEMIGALPKTVDISENLRNQAVKGEIDWLRDPESGEKLSGEPALERINTISNKINNLIKSVKDMGRATENTNPKKNIKFIDDSESFKQIEGYLGQAESLINNQLGNKVPIDFSSMPDIGGFMKLNQIKKSKKMISKLFDRQNIDHDEIKQALAHAGILVRSDGDLTDTFFLKGDIQNINITGAPSDTARASAYKLLNAVHQIVGAKGQYKVDTSGIEIDIDYNLIAGNSGLQGVLDRKGLNTHEGLLDMYKRDIVRTIITDNIAGSKLTESDINILMDLNITGFDVVKFTPSSRKGKFGFAVRKLQTVSSDETINAKVNEFNEHIDNISSRGENIVVKEKDPLVIADGLVDELHSKINSSIGSSAELTKNDLADFINIIEGPDSFKNNMISFMQDHQSNPQKLMAFLMKNKIVKINKGPGSKKYDYNTDLLTEARMDEISEIIERAGVINNVDAYYKEIEEHYHAMMKGDYDPEIGTKKLSQADFFEKYYPDYVDSKDQSAFISETIRLDGGLGDINPNRIQDVINKLTVNVKQGDKDVRVKVSSLNPNSTKYRQARSDVAALISSKINSVKVKMIGFRDNGLDFTESIMQDNGLTRMLSDMKLDYFLVNPVAIARLKNNAGFIQKRIVDISSLESNKARHTDDQKAVYANFKEQLENVSKYTLNNKTEDVTGDTGRPGLVMIQFSDWLPPIAIKKSDASKIYKAFEDMFVKYDKGGVYRKNVSQEAIKRMSDFRENLRNEKQAFDFHEDALRSMMYEKMVGPTRFLELMNLESGELYKKTSKRGSLFYTPSAKRMTSDGISALDNILVNSDEINIVNKYKNQNGYGLAVFDDTHNRGFGTSVKNRINRDLKSLELTESFNDLQPGRDDVSGFDSISYISTDFAKMLSMYYGLDFDGTQFIFKPIISSNAMGKTMYGKTVFIHDPTMQHVFNKNQGLDVLLAKSGAKIGAETNETFGQVMIKKHTDEIFDVNQDIGSLSKNTINMDFNSLGVIQAPKKKANAKLSHALWNYSDDATNSMIFSKHLEGPLNRSMRNIEEMYSNPALLRHALLKLQGIDNDFSMSAMTESGAAGKNMGAFIQFLQSDKNANPLAFGDRMVMNILKRKLINPNITPETVSDGTRYGGQAVLAQSINPKYRNLKQTIVLQGEVVQHGEMYLPGYEADSDIRVAGNKDLKIKIIKRNKGQTPDSIIELDDLYKEFSAGNKNTFDNITTLGQLNDLLTTLPNNYQMGVVTTRYPRTRPNDMMILGVKGFLEKEFGNSMIVNDYDVLSVFEGDYDVDKAHYTWLNTDESFSHIQNMKEYWIPGVEPGQFTPEVPNLQLMSSNPVNSNQAWRESAADVKAFKSGIGVVQKLTRQVNHIKNLSSTIELENQNMGLLFKNGDGDKIVIDYDNKEWFMRMALEGQAIIDAQADKTLFTEMQDWKDEFLFPLRDESVTRNELKADNGKSYLKSRQSNSNDKRRIRLFRKFDKKGIESDAPLTKIEKDMIRTIMNEYSKMLQLGTDVYDGTGQSRSPDYLDMVSVGGEYFNHIKDLNQSVYKKLRKKYSNNDEFNALFPERDVPIYKWDKKTKKRVQDGNKTYKWLQGGQGPFDSDVVTRGEGISKGSRGTPFERSLRLVKENDPLNSENRVALLRSEYARLDNELDKFLGDHIDEDSFLSTIMGAMGAKNKSISTIKWAKSQIYKARSPKQVDALNRIISEQETFLKEQLGVSLSKEYEKTRMAKYLPEAGRLVSIEKDADVREGTIQYYVLAPELNNFKGSHPDFGSDLAQIKNLERTFYADDIKMKETLPYRDNTLLTKEQRLKLKFRPDQDTFNEVFTELMDRYIDKHGMMFLWNYAAPKQMKNNVGVYNNRVMPVATAASKRYKRALNFIGRKAGEDSYYKQVLGVLAKRDGTYRNLFSGNVNALGLTPDAMTDQMLRVPKFGAEMIGMFDSYTKYNVDRDMDNVNPYRSGPGFDHATAFFKKIYEMAGRGGEFDTEMKGISQLNQIMMDNRLVDPLTFNALTSKINKDIYSFVKQRFKYVDGGMNITDENMLNNDMFIMIGGNNMMGRGGITLNPVDAMNFGKGVFGELMGRQAHEIVTKPSSDRLDTLLNCTKA